MLDQTLDQPKEEQYNYLEVVQAIAETKDPKDWMQVATKEWSIRVLIIP